MSYLKQIKKLGKMLGNDEELIINMVEDDFKDGFIRGLLFNTVAVDCMSNDKLKEYLIAQDIYTVKDLLAYVYSNLDLELAVPAKQDIKVKEEQLTPTNPVQLRKTNKNISRTGKKEMKW